MPRVPSLAALLLLITSVAAFGADPAMVVAVEKDGDSFMVDATITITVPVHTAWEVLTDFNNMVGILSNLTLSRIIRRKGSSVFVMQEGTARYGPFSYSFASVREMQLEPMKRILAIQLTGNAKRFESEMLLSETRSGTRVHYHAVIVPDSGIARTFGGPFIQHEVEEQFALMAAEMMRRKAQ